MSIRRILALLAGGLTVTAFVAAGPAVADDEMPACSLGPLCNMLPIAPQLDHDIDLTKDQPPMLNPDSAPPLDPCSAGCI